MQLFHWPLLGALHGIAVLSAPALFAMAAFAPDLTIEFASAEGADDAEDIIELTEDAVEVADTIEEAAEEAVEEAVEDEVEETIEEAEVAEELEEAVEEEVAEELEDEAEEELEEAIEEEAEEEIEEAIEEAEDSEPTCWVTPSGSLYHLDPDCTYIRNKDALTLMTIETAEASERRPCSRCAQ